MVAGIYVARRSPVSAPLALGYSALLGLMMGAFSHMATTGTNSNVAAHHPGRHRHRRRRRGHAGRLLDAVRPQGLEVLEAVHRPDDRLLRPRPRQRRRGACSASATAGASTASAASASRCAPSAWRSPAGRCSTTSATPTGPSPPAPRATGPVVARHGALLVARVALPRAAAPALDPQPLVLLVVRAVTSGWPP